MQLTLDSTILEKLFAHAASAALHVGHISDTVDGDLAVGPLADHIDAIAHELGELLGKPHLIAVRGPSARAATASKAVRPGDPLGEHRLTAELADDDETDVVDELRQLMGRADALASATDELFNRIGGLTDGADRRCLARLAHLVEMTALAVSAASEASSKLIATVERELSRERT